MAPAMNLSSSPPSGGSRTIHNTPSTVPTMHSPAERESDADIGLSVPKFDLASNQNAGYASTSFGGRRNLHVAPITVPTLTDGLSPMADEFTPSLNIPTAKPNPGIIGSGAVRQSISTYTAPVFQIGRFTVNDQATRAFLVAGVSGPSVGWMYEMIAVSYKNFGSIVNINARQLDKGIFSVEFANFDDAKQALVMTIDFIFRHQNIACYKLLPRDVAQANGESTIGISNHAAEYTVSAIDVGNRVAPITGDDLLRACQACGQVKAFHTVKALVGAVMSFRVEWTDTRTNVTSLSMAMISGYRISIMPFTPDLRTSQKMAVGASSDEQTRNVFAFLNPPTPRITHINANGNVVDIMKIMLGQDVRTTIMLRNIPNRVDQSGLKKLLDETSFGQFDFMYLRIDFANNCNVGYAFINFVDPMAIVPFAKARAGQKWNLFQSDKIAEISYATIQGKDCLVQKFRNSSVMMENPSFRPKLYRVGNGEDAGLEEDFPAPDNAAKLKRSCDNAEHVGLYIPESPTRPRFSPSYGPDTTPAPRNQKAGGVYTKPAPTRRALAFKQALDHLEGRYAERETNADIYPNHTFPPSQPGEHTSSMRRRSSKSKTLANVLLPGLFAPRESQIFKERNRRQYSQYDRGTPGAMSEASNNYDTSFLSNSFGGLRL
ncbi:hypothetical protein PMZ80_006107 [Knufia obscura]|uniref:RRM domain-containing protein n=1 Tax=Knufia obscura TaxID=1635080 RepID=A0ABR0RNG2_9EURO|nr:hypothetical protein PMZ80_006107 [Knufia obscura]